MKLRAALILFLTAFAFGGPPEIPGPVLEREVVSRMRRVDEFAFLKKEAEKMGVHAWLFGGTASSYAHYVKWDLQREAGDDRYQPNRFEQYDYYDIFRSTQDLDILIDGTEEQAAALEELLRKKFPHAQGSKSAWEVRLLRASRGDKEAVLDNPDFVRQNSDSNSTGMIEVTVPRKGEHPIRDARDLQARHPKFFEDVRLGKLHYYYDPESHKTTKRFIEGKNPEIFSAIRYLTKAFQYELAIEPGDLAKIVAVVNAFDPAKDLAKPAAREWIERNAPKLFQHAVNLEYAERIISQVGLKEKLIALGDPKREGTMAWWLSREPLPSFPLGQGDGTPRTGQSGKSARELGLTVVAHETKDFLAYESITRSHKGEPNVFLSRPDTEGESASSGRGFYTAAGRQGLAGTGLTIRFMVDPAAVEGRDFIVTGYKDPTAPIPEHSEVIFLNKRALRVIPESLTLKPADYLRLISSGGKLSRDDRGILEKLRRKLSKRLSAKDGERAEVRQVVTDEAKKEIPRRAVLTEWMRFDPGHIDITPTEYLSFSREDASWDRDLESAGEALKRDLKKRLAADPKERAAAHALALAESGKPLPSTAMLWEWTQLDPELAKKAFESEIRLPSFPDDLRTHIFPLLDIYKATGKPPALGKVLLEAYARHLLNEPDRMGIDGPPGAPPSYHYRLYKDFLKTGQPLPPIELELFKAAKEAAWKTIAKADKWTGSDKIKEVVGAAVAYGWKDSLLEYENEFFDRLAAEKAEGPQWFMGLYHLESMSEAHLDELASWYPDTRLDPGLRQSAVYLLGKFRQKDPAWLKRLAEAVSDETLAEPALAMLEKSQTKDPVIHKLMLEGLKHEKSQYQVIYAFEGMDISDPDAQLAFAKYLDKDSHAHSLIYKTLRRWKVSAPSVWHYLADRLDIPTTEYRASTKKDGPPELLSLFPDHVKLIETLTELGAADEYVLHKLARAASNRVPEIARAARSALETLDHTGCVRPLHGLVP